MGIEYAQDGYVCVGWVDQGLVDHVDRFTRSLVDPRRSTCSL